MKQVKATIVKIEGTAGATCSFEHQVGEEFIFDQYGVNKKMCIYAQAALLPAINALMHDGNFSWLPSDEKIYWGCPHPGSMYKNLGQIIFQLEVI